MITSIPQRARGLRPIIAALAVVLACASCKSNPPLPGDLKVGEITTGRIVGADGAITDESRTNLFWTTDNFYVSVATEGAAQNVALAARWTGPDGKVAAEVPKTISPAGAVTTSFEAVPKDGRWPAGDYKVDILVNGVSQGSKDINAR